MSIRPIDGVPLPAAPNSAELEKAVREAFPYVFTHYRNDARIPVSFSMLRDLLMVNRAIDGVQECAHQKPSPLDTHEV